MTDLRVAILAHAHPALSKGGGEILAHRSFVQLRERLGRATLLATLPRHVPGAVSLFSRDERIVAYDRDEYLLDSQGYDPFLGASSDEALFEAIADLCAERHVNVFHFHHFFGLGTNAAAALRRRFPDAVFVLTLHEYLAICHQHGQMVKRNSRQLCTRASPVDCHVCFPEHAREEFALRAALMRQMIATFDAVTAPSAFLAARVAAAGLSDEVRLIRNGTSDLAPEAFGGGVQYASASLPQDLPRSFAFFGQPTPYKGIDVFLRAALAFLEREGPAARFAVFGCDAARVRAMPECQDLLSGLDRWTGSLMFHGVYDPEAVVAHMRGWGWVVVPSIWWENAPVVIQEAFLAGRPVICSGIGGLREAVSHGRDGLHVRPNDWMDLARTFSRGLHEDGLWRTLQAQVAPPRSIAAMNDEFVSLYQSLLAR
ncbi:glycosyltransferase [Methylobacterium sp. SyP6R]|uniref:glycosyltransferase n=1 Tax=Methylobacterium sp. SyP6R TaxID=2718876 RepID=UPI001F34FA20|nr:glycosyltransferase [Methylobacterium sp. SyP6R]MCF4130158.1 glycosyltransferase [Methylobacterium sp. SyP6R]